MRFSPEGKRKQKAHPSLYPDGACQRSSPQMEAGIGRQEPISHSESDQTQSTDHYGYNGLEAEVKERGSSSLSDLPFEERVLHTPELGRA
jgi:hypothetical protein